MGRKIVRTPGVCGGQARIDNTRVPVWLLKLHWDAGQDNVEIVETFPTIWWEDIDAAKAYEREHPEEIAEDLRQNQLKEKDKGWTG